MAGSKSETLLMDSIQSKILSSEIRDHLLEHILPFWCGPAVDRKHGGWMAWLSNDLTPDHAQPKGLVLNARILWTFSAVHRVRPEGIYHEMADRALDVLLGDFWDRRDGGAFWTVSSDGRVIDDSKKTYGQAFCIYALAEYHLAFGLPESFLRARDLFDLLQRHAHDDRYGGYWEVRQRDWSEAADNRLSEKDMNEKKSMNNHLHVLEAYANLYRIWNDPRLEKALRELVDLFVERILDTGAWHLHHFFNELWEVRSASYVFGHDIEASWLLCEAAETLMDSALIESTQYVALQIAAAALEGLDADGGLCYEGKRGQIVDRRKEWWPQAEALVGFINAYEISANERFLDAACGLWTYIQQHLVDCIHGEWYWRINEDGTHDSCLPKVSQWKDPYHAARACLQAWRRLERISRGEMHPTARIY
jgi:cellobiose epimerase